MADSELLNAFALRRDEAAFRCLTERYAGLVHGIAVRRLGNPHTAQEVTSEVFILLARKASKLTKPGCLAAWLQRTAALTAANAVRRENRRHAAMNAYANSLETPSPAGHPAWREAVPHLDEALARLGDRDRELIMARYFNGLSHGEIACERGATADAVKKAGQRALDKLCGLLRKRGVVIPTVLLASGLANHVQAAAPPGTAQRAAAAAVTGSGQAGLFTALHHSLVYMTYGKPLTSASVLLLLCAALGCGSWLAAYSLAVAGSVPTPLEARQGGIHSPYAPVAAASGSSSSHEVREILRQAVNLIRQSTGLAGPEADRAMDRAILLLSTLPAGDMKAAAQTANEYRSELTVAYRLGTALAAVWSEQDPEGALEWVENFPSPMRMPGERGTTGIVHTWFESDSPAAWRWWLRRSQAVPPPLPDWNLIIAEALANWMHRDPAAAVLAAGQAPTGSEMIIRRFAGELARLQVRVDSPAVEAAMQWSNPSLRAELARGLSLNRGDQNESSDAYFSRIFPVLNRLCGDDAGSMESAVAPLVREWARTAPEKAVGWILSGTDSSPTNTWHLLRPALKEWAAKDPAEAWHWLEQTTAADPGQSGRLYSAILEKAPASSMAAGAAELPAAWVDQIATAAPESQDRVLHFWAQRQLELGAANGETTGDTLAEWQAGIQKAEASGATAAIALARRALEFARQTANLGPEGEATVNSSNK